MKTQSLDQAQIIQEWRETLNQLIREVSEWVKEQPGWSVLPISQKEITEEAIGTYTAPVLTIDTADGRLILEPMARIVFGGRGTVEFYAWPTLYRVRLVRRAQEEEWTILTDSGIRYNAPWNQATFLTLAKELLGAG